MSTKSEVEITDAGLKAISKAVGGTRVAKAKKDGLGSQSREETKTCRCAASKTCLKACSKTAT